MLDVQPRIKAESIRVLHVDDDQSMLDISKIILTEMNSSFVIDIAFGVDEALKKIAEKDYDVVVSDYEMPQKNGLDFLMELKAKNYVIPFILFTGKGREEIAIKALNLGANGYYNKQGSPETVYGELAFGILQSVQHKKAQDELRKSELILENSSDSIIVTDLAGNITSWNKGAENIFGYTSQEMVGKHISIVVKPQEKEGAPKQLDDIRRGIDFSQYWEGIRKDGSAVWLLLTTKLLKNNKDEPVAMVGFGKDVTQQKENIESLNESRQRFSGLSSAAFEGIVVSRDGKILDANNQCAQMFGYELTEILGKDVIDFVAPESREFVRANIEKGNEGPYEHLALRKDGYIFPVEIRAKSIHFNGQLARVTAIQNITENKKTENELRKNEQRIKNIINSSTSGIYALDKNWNFVYINERMAKLVGSTPEKMIGRNGWLFFSKLRGTIVEKNLCEVMETREQRTFEWSGLYSNENWEIHVFPSEDGISVFSDDITDRKKAERLLKSSEEKFRHAFETAQDGFLITSRNDGRIIETNERSAEIFGYNKKELLGKTTSELGFWANPSDRKILSSKLNSDGKIRNLEFTFRKKNGEVFTGQLSSSLLNLNNQQLIVSVFRDISNSKNVEEGLRDSETRFRKLVMHLPDTIYMLDLVAHKTQFLSREEFLGYSKAELESESSILGAIHPDDKPSVEKNWQELVQGKTSAQKPIEYRLKSKNGSWEWVESRATVIKQNKESKPEQLLITLSEITARKNLEEDKVVTLELLNIANKSTNLNQLVVSAVDFFQKQTGCEAVGIRLKDKNDYPYFETRGFPPEHIIAENSLCSKCDTGYNCDFEGNPVLECMCGNIINGRFDPSKEFFTENGSFWTNSTSKLLASTTEQDRQARTRNRCNGEGYESVALIPLHVGSRRLGLLQFNDKRKDIFTLEGINRWERLADELSLSLAKSIAEEELKQKQVQVETITEKLRVVGSLTRHDVGNKLIAAKSNVYLLKKRLGDNPELIKYFDAIASAFAASDRIFEFSRLYERIGAEKPSKENVFESFNKAAALIPDLTNVEILNECMGLEVVADSLLSQLFFNLIDNSLKHGEKVTQIRFHYTKEGEGLKLIYEDNGVGVLDANKPKLFEVGFTTGKGSGLGLYLVKKMMDVYGWKISEEGTPGQGAKFVITITQQK